MLVKIIARDPYSFGSGSVKIENRSETLLTLSLKISLIYIYVQNEVNPDHLYLEVKREPKVFQPLQIPRALQAELPYHLKPKVPYIVLF